MGRDLFCSLSFVGAVATGALLAAAYPPLEWAGVAWIALIPLCTLAWRERPAAAFRFGFIAGVVFWWMSLFWLTEVTWAGWMLLGAYCAVYPAAFAAASSWLFRQGNPDRWTTRAGWLLGVPMSWVGAEFLRSILFTGFAWNPLGGSQYQQTAVIQCAAWTGVYGVSALIVFINVAVFLTLQRYVRAAGRRPAWHPELLLGLLLMVSAVVGGARAIRGRAAEETVRLRSAVIQPNIPQYEKWSTEFVDVIFERLQSLTQMALHAGQPDWVIWPETAVPDYVRDSERSYALVRHLTALGAPLLVGSMDIEWVDNAWPRYYNSSLLFDRAGRLMETYDKQHLVMFGEYVPLQRVLPFLKAMTPIEESFDPGYTSTVFTLTEPPIRFAVLICFEDTVARLARRAVRKGARLLVNQTNDAWFRETAASRQHMTHSVFRAVETGVPLVRAANTGVSCGIDRFGRIHDVLQDDRGNTFVSGFHMVVSDVPSDDMPLTFYTRYGDVFGWTGVVWLIGIALSAGWRYKREKAGDS